MPADRIFRVTGNKDEPERTPLRVLLVGERRAGKTTCCVTAARMIREEGLRPGGVVCPKLLEEGGEVIGIEVVDLLSDPPSRELLARTDRSLGGPSIGVYAFSEKGLEFGRRALEAGAERGDVVFGDELGPLEMLGQGFTNLLTLARRPSTPPMVLVVRTGLSSDVRKELEPLPVTMLEIDSANRDQAPRRLVDLLCRGF
jgi:nucleoside-triphosphatase THEP1